MKHAFILIALAVVVFVGTLFFIQSRPAVLPPTPPEENVEETEKDHADMTTKEQAGTDAGMEFPTPDTTTTTVDPNAKVFEVSGKNFSYDVAEIRVKEGDTVIVNFTSADGFHDWVVDEFSAATEKVQTGGKTSVTFVADKKGTFEYYCSVGKHRANGMVGTLIVE
jgi:plastocyanin